MAMLPATHPLYDSSAQPRVTRWPGYMPPILEDAPEATKCDKVAVLAAISLDKRNYEFCSSDLRLDPEVAIHALRHGVALYKFPRGLYTNETVALAMIEVDPSYISSPFIKPKTDAMLRAALVDKCPMHVLQNATEAQRRDKPLVLEIVGRCAFGNLSHVHESLRHDKEVLLAAARSEWPQGLDHEDMLSDVQVALAAVNNQVCGDMFFQRYFEPEPAKADKTTDVRIVLAAVRASKIPYELSWTKYLSTELQQDAYLQGWLALNKRARRARRLREAARKQTAAWRQAVPAQVDLWLIRNGLGDWIHAKRAKTHHI